MFNIKRLHNDEAGQTALETAIILIAFVVVASVFAFAILSAGSASTDKGQKAIAAGLEGVQSSMSLKGSVIANAAGTTVDNVVFTVSLASGGEPIDLTSPNGPVLITYRDGSQFVNNASWTVNFPVEVNKNSMLEAGEVAEITVDLSGLTTKLDKNTEFTIEIKPPKGAVITITRSTPAAIAKVMELH